MPNEGQQRNETNLKQTQPADAMPLSPTHHGQIVAVLAFFLTCFLTNAVMMLAIIKHLGEIKRCPASALSLNLLLGGLIFGLVGFLINMDKLVKNDHHYTGDFLCQIEGAVITLGGAATITGNAVIAMERYFVIVWNHKMTLDEVIKLSAAGWVWILTLALLPIILPDGQYVPQASEVYCLAEWWGTKPAVLAEVYLCALTCVGALLFIGYAYGSIALLVYCNQKELENIFGRPLTTMHTTEKNNTSSGQSHPMIQATSSFNIGEDSPFPERRDTNRPLVKSPTTSNISKKDRQIYLKVVCIASGYIIFWGPYAVIMITGIVLKSKVPPIYCITAGLLAIFNGVANVIIIGVLDPVYKKVLAKPLKRIPLLCRLASESESGDV